MLLFHLQQAVEKFLKALLSAHNIKFPKVHDIEKLIELCEENKISLPEYVEKFIDLTPYAVEFRYGLMMDEVLDVNYYYQEVLKFKRFVEKIICKF
jgi:HEPN domain-containing protein